MSIKRPAIGGVMAMVCLASGLAGCATDAPQPPVSPSSSAVAALPAGGVFLRDLRFDNGFSFSRAPASFSIPAGVTPIGGANLQERINVIFAPEDGPVVYDYLMAHLDEMGCRITASSADSIVWDDGVWDGAFTMTATQAGLTFGLRS